VQKISAYLLERREGVDSIASVSAQKKRIRDEILQWLVTKGGSDNERTGSYLPLDGSQGQFTIEEAVDENAGSWWMLKLHEDTADGRRFETSISITAEQGLISVYATLETGWVTPHIMPISVDPRCPKVIRSLLELPGRWYNGTSSVQPRRPVRGFVEGLSLATEILEPERTIPLLAVSTHDGDVALPELDLKLSYDLAGLVNVVVLNHEASWGLTDALGSDFTCHSGSVRLYWPHFAATRDRYRHPLWTPSRLFASDDSELDIRDRFREQMRRMVFRASTLSVIRPWRADVIRDGANRGAMTQLRQHAKSLQEYHAIADSYASDNDALRRERDDVRGLVQGLEAQVARLEGERLALLTQLRAAGRSPSAQAVPAKEILPDADPVENELGEPQPGELRFYKKMHAAPTHDVMTRVADCGCNKWQTSHAADKARKGIAKVEGGRDNWRGMQHCATCTGGGMWKVKW